MAIIQQIPATIDVVMIRGDEYSWPLVFSEDLSDYTFSVGVYKPLPAPAIDADVANVITPQMAVTIGTGSSATTTVLLSVTEAMTLSLSATQLYRWYLRWVSPGGVTRTVVSGSFKVNLP